MRRFKAWEVALWQMLSKYHRQDTRAYIHGKQSRIKPLPKILFVMSSKVNIVKNSVSKKVKSSHNFVHNSNHENRIVPIFLLLTKNGSKKNQKFPKESKAFRKSFGEKKSLKGNNV